MKKNQLHAGLSYEFRFRISADKTVPHLYAESQEFSIMQDVLATGYIVGLFEWTCIRAINPYINWPHELTVGTYVNVSH